MKISACVPIYNTAPRYLADLIGSILSQSHADFEVVLCDDCSTVDYGPVLESHRADRRIRYLRNESNLGMVHNWNAAVRYSDGELVIVLGHDDMIAPQMFAAYAEAFSRAPDVVLVSSGVQFVDERGQPIDAIVNVNHRANIFIDQPEYLLNGREAAYLCLRNGGALGELSVQMFRRAVFEAVGAFDPAFRHGADVDLSIRVTQRGKCIYLNQPFLLRRLHKRNLTWHNLAVGNVSHDRALRFERHKHSYNFRASEVARFKAYLVACAAYDIIRTVKHRNPQVMGDALRQIIRYSGLKPTAYLSLLCEIVTGRNRDRR
jgi:glycosyltransferase involved in cell wall biosynthesis